jgi:hypothetical protein
MRQSMSTKWVGILVFGALLQYGDAYKAERGRLTQWMQVEEPSGQGKNLGIPAPIEVTNPATVVPAGERRSEMALTPKEQTQVLLHRMEAQKALRDFKAKKMAKHRRSGSAAWKRELEGFLMAQRKIEREQVKLDGVSRSLPKKGKKAPDSEWHPIRKGRVLT